MSCIWVWKPELNVLFLVFTITNVDDASDIKISELFVFKAHVCLISTTNATVWIVYVRGEYFKWLEQIFDVFQKS